MTALLTILFDSASNTVAGMAIGGHRIACQRSGRELLMIQQGAAAVKVRVGVQIEQQVEVFLVNHVPSNPEADGKLL